LVTLVVMGVITIASMNILGNHVKKSANPQKGGGGCSWELVCSNNSAVLAEYDDAPRCDQYTKQFDLDHQYYVITKLSNGIKIGSVINYIWYSPDTQTAMISSGDGWDDLTIFPVGSGFATGPYWFVNNGSGLDTYPDADINTYAQKRDISAGAAGKPSAQNGYLTVGTGFRGYGKNIDTIYQQAYFCSGEKVKVAHGVSADTGKTTICGGTTGVDCDSYTGTFDFDHVYYVDLSNTANARVYFPATAISLGGGSIILHNDVIDGGSFHVESTGSGLRACYQNRGGSGGSVNTGGIYSGFSCTKQVTINKIDQI